MRPSCNHNFLAAEQSVTLNFLTPQALSLCRFALTRFSAKALQICKACSKLKVKVASVPGPDYETREGNFCKTG